MVSLLTINWSVYIRIKNEYIISNNTSENMKEKRSRKPELPTAMKLALRSKYKM